MPLRLGGLFLALVSLGAPRMTWLWAFRVQGAVKPRGFGVIRLLRALTLGSEEFYWGLRSMKGSGRELSQRVHTTRAPCTGRPSAIMLPSRPEQKSL